MVPLQKQLLVHIFALIHEYNNRRICIIRKIIVIQKLIKNKISSFKPKYHTHICMCIHIYIHLYPYVFLYMPHLILYILHIYLNIYLYNCIVSYYLHITICSYTYPI